ncbi:MAG: ethanolamine ammonia-lyase subunit EutB [Planctomycetaceae bacterium]|nr:ethanolamine ammonia-lyase subunit EutB [Planctomycetaceae bacterium]
MDLRRRQFLQSLSALTLVAATRHGRRTFADDVAETAARGKSNDGLAAYLKREHGDWNEDAYKALLGAANEFKEGDALIGIAARDEAHRQMARRILSRTTLHEIDAHTLQDDELDRALRAGIDQSIQKRIANWTLEELADFLLEQPESVIQPLLPGLSSDVIGCVVKLLDNRQLTVLGAKLFHPLPGSRIGAKGYLGARIQPNSPTDNVDDIRWQVFNGWAYAVGDVVLGNNPVSNEPKSVLAIERCLKEALETFGIADVLPHCVLAHIDVQAEVEALEPGSTALWFQSIAGSDAANATFDVSLAKLLDYAGRRSGPFGLYFETGQGADFTNGHGAGYDMVLHESRKYGLARLLSRKVAEAIGPDRRPWVHVNDVAGFIGPEVFRTREQLVRCCLEDIAMGKLHGLCIGLDVCTTLHMDVSLDDLDWCLDQLIPACPAYLMALPTKIDPMLGYLTTGFQDHVRLREKFGCRVNDAMWSFFQRLGVINEDGSPTQHFGDPSWIYLHYRRRKGDQRDEDVILAEGRAEMAAVRQRGVFLAEGHGERSHDVEPALASEMRRVYVDAKQSLWSELDAPFFDHYPGATLVATRSINREDYILHPTSGEHLNDESVAAIARLRERQRGLADVQIVLSDGLNALAIRDREQLDPFLAELKDLLASNGFHASDELILMRSGRVRAGYEIGRRLFSELPGKRAMLHVVGERPGTGHRTFSVYQTCVTGSLWGQQGAIDHHVTKVVAGIANTALRPRTAAEAVARLLNQQRAQG